MERRTPEVRVAEAINHVLAAESEAAVVIAAAEREAEAVMEAARGRRRQILERTRRRASRLHARAQQHLRQAIEELDRTKPAQDADLDTLRARSRAAVAELAKRLTSQGDGPH